MNAGELRHRVTIQEATESRDSYGAAVETWSDLVTVWAKKAHKSSREFFAAQKVCAETTDLWIIRYRSGITTKMRIVYRDHYYDIVGAFDPDGRGRELHLLCKEVT